MKYKDITIVMVSNILLEPFFNTIINDIFSKIFIKPKILYIPYVIYQYKNEKFEQADITIIILDIETLIANVFNDIYAYIKCKDIVISEVIHLCNNIQNYIKKYSSSQILFFGFEDYSNNENFVKGNVNICLNLIDEINIQLYQILNEQTTYIDLKRLIANVGINNFFDSKGKYRWNAPYSRQLMNEIAKEVYKQYLIQKNISPKCIILDCDNVLWGGILSEEGIENIKLGNSGLGLVYQDFQKYLLTLYYHGVILTICSKNDKEDVIKMFHEHNEMILKEEHISCFQVNWKNKYENIKEISEFLNIGLESMVFIDDNSFEIESIKMLLPEVTTILYEKDNIYRQMSCFNLKSKVSLENIKQRNLTYQTNIFREKLKEQCIDYNTYLKSLDIRIKIKNAGPIDYNRISELSQRTNKCTNGMRYTVYELKEKIKSGQYKLYSVYASDKFSDLGLVGTIGIMDNILDLYSLSCRALGRDIENKIIMYIIQRYKIDIIYFISTGKNNELKELLKIRFKYARFTEGY